MVIERQLRQVMWRILVAIGLILVAVVVIWYLDINSQPVSPISFVISIFVSILLFTSARHYLKR